MKNIPFPDEWDDLSKHLGKCEEAKNLLSLGI